MFSNSEFFEACAELDTPDVAEWDFFTEAKGVKIYRQYNEDSGLFSFKLYGKIDVSPEVCTKVFMDLDYRKTWDGYVKELKEVTENADRKVIYWQVKFPFPMKNRDYVYVRKMQELDIESRHVWVILCKIVESPYFPLVEGVIRVSEFFECLAMRSSESGGTEVFMKYYDNPGGRIPSWLINWAAQRGVPSFLSDIEKACSGYATYMRSSRSSVKPK